MNPTGFETGHEQATNARALRRRAGSALVLATGSAVILLSASRLDLMAQRYPHIGYIHPAGGRQGTTFEVRVGGQYLAGATEVYMSGTGVTATVVDYDRPIAQKRVNEMREKLKDVRTQMIQARREGRFSSAGEAMKLFVNLAEEQGIALEELKKAADYRRQRQDPKHQLNPQIAETVGLKVTITPDAGPGVRELRLRTRAGLSNPLTFCIGQLPEVCETHPEPELTWEDLVGARRGAKRAAPPNQIQRLTLPCVVNGQILPGEVDRFRFAARKGQHLVAAVSARSLIPYLADAVPGWFQPTEALFDSRGNELAYDDDFRFHPDPVLFCVIPRDGDYTLEIKDAIYRGREDFVYRIALGELPFLTGIFPLGGEAGERTQLSLSGWNLPEETLSVLPDSSTGRIMEVRVTRDGRLSNPAPFAVGSMTECTEHEPNNVSANAQHITPPVVINGRIDAKDDWDVFAFEGRAGEEWVAEVFARRLESPLDSILKLTDPDGREMAVNDDCMDEGSGLITHHADSRLRVRLPVDGVYHLHLGEAQGRGGDAYAYRLQVAPPHPDFELRVVPSSLNVRAGSSVPLTVHVLRRDGFTNEIKLALVEAPPGFTLANTRLAGNTNLFRVFLRVAATARRQASDIRIEGRALVEGRGRVRQAVPADDLMQAFIYRHLVPAQEMKVAVTGRISPRRRPGNTETSSSPPRRSVVSGVPDPGSSLQTNQVSPRE